MEFSLATKEQIETIAEIEKNSYPSDESASLEKMIFRRKTFPSLFMCATINEEIVGYICSTRCDVYDESTMEFNFEPEGKLVAIHSVVVSSGHRRKGIATKMMNHYLKLIRQSEKNVESAVLITKGKNLNLYLGCGFKCEGKSSMVHGKDTWFLCSVSLQDREFHIVDAFADTAGKGNPAAVVSCLDVLDPDLEKLKPWMQQVAAEFNLSETAFVFRFETEENFKVLFFTPTAQVIFCGHATLATAKVMLEKFKLSKINIEVEDKRVIPVEVHGSQYKLLLPKVEIVDTEDLQKSSELINVLGIEEGAVVAVKVARGSEKSVLIEVTPKAFTQVYEKNIDFVQMGKICPDIIILTTRKLACEKIGTFDFTKYKDQWQFDVYSRVFAPGLGIDEDPVTGAAHAVLFPYYFNDSEFAGKTTIAAFQASKRGGILKGLKTDSGIEVLANAVSAASGYLYY